MPRDIIPLYQVTHLRSDPYWYWDACFDSQKDWKVILEWEDTRGEQQWKAMRKRENQRLAMRYHYLEQYHDESERAFNTWEAQVRGRLEGMTVCTSKD
jgi:hypothetical protein